jgi:hypothetical protein
MLKSIAFFLVVCLGLITCVKEDNSNQAPTIIRVDLNDIKERKSIAALTDVALEFIAKSRTKQDDFEIPLIRKKIHSNLFFNLLLASDFGNQSYNIQIQLVILNRSSVL